MPLGAIPFPFGICRICRDKATGLHYGVATCEGCKGFFKRNIAKGESFQCHFGGSCDLTPKTRSHCKACRFKRCMETGMSVEGVRMGRVPKLEKEKVLEAYQDGGANFSNHELVLQRLDGGSYKFELNKTLTDTNSTLTIPKTSVSNIHMLTDETTNEKDISTRHESKQTGTELKYQTSNHRSSVSDGGKTIECSKMLTNITEDILPAAYQRSVCHAKMKTGTDDLNSRSKISNSKFFTPMNEKIYDDKCHIPNQRTSSCMKGETDSEKCENPFNDTYVVKKVCQDQETLRSEPIQQFSAADYPWENLMRGTNEQFRTMMNLSNENNHCLGNTRQEKDNATFPYYCQSGIALSQFAHTPSGKLILSNTNALEPYSKPHSLLQSSPLSKTEIHKDEFSTPGTCSDNLYLCKNLQASNIVSDDSSPRRRSSFSPALINVLLEQVLESNDAVHVIAEKIQQKQKQGYFSPSCAQTLCQHISEASVKRRRISEDDFSASFQVEQKLNACQSSAAHLDNDFVRNHQDINRPITSLMPLNDGVEAGPSCRRQCGNYAHKSSDHSTMAVTSGKPLLESSKNEVPQENVMVSSGVVSSSLASEEEESKSQEIKNILDGIAIGMNILNRLKPEHREKIRQYKLGKLKIRAMTDTDEDVKETYSKIINSIPNLNERILGFCNSVPGFADILKDDRDILMKRAYYDIWMLSYSEYMQGDESYMLLDTGEFYSQLTMRKILNDDMVDKIFLFANQFNRLELTDMEIAILCAARLTCADELELSDRSKVVKLHSQILDAFASEVEKNHEANHARILIDTFRLMPLLEVVNRIQKDIISKYSV